MTITDSDHVPPHFSDVPHLMDLADLEFEKQLGDLKECEGMIFGIRNSDVTDEVLDCIDRVIRVAVWLHHKITYIHPFREGNGRKARLAANLVLERYGLVGISVKVEKENKNRYRQTLAQIDRHHDYEPFIGIMYEGLTDRYNGVVIKYYNPT